MGNVGDQVVPFHVGRWQFFYAYIISISKEGSFGLDELYEPMQG